MVKNTENTQQDSSFISFILLSEAKFDKQKFKEDFKNNWDIDVEDDEENNNKSEDVYVFNVGDMIATVSLMPAPIPGDETVLAASANYQWPEAVERAKAHKAHLIVAVLGKVDPKEKGTLFVKIIDTCCNQDNILGIYKNSTVLYPELYKGFAETIKEGNLPIFNLVWIGFFRSENGANAYTSGLSAFGKYEIEIIDTSVDINEIYDFLINIVFYILEQDVTLNDGETIGATAEQKMPITLSEGVSVKGKTLKIGYSV